ncbi:MULTISPECIES: hypothetical protein [Roseovarius]|nr:hypothetical protein [Roseovarius nubinhibens]MBU3000205.1 hypothetical protein [Roseovarius nubinhibens]
MKRLIPALAIGLTLISAALPVHALSLDAGNVTPTISFPAPAADTVTRDAGRPAH